MAVYALIEKEKSLWIFEDIRTRKIWFYMQEPEDAEIINQKRGKELMKDHFYSKHVWEEPKIKGRKK